MSRLHSRRSIPDSMTALYTGIDFRPTSFAIEVVFCNCVRHLAFEMECKNAEEIAWKALQMERVVEMLMRHDRDCNTGEGGYYAKCSLSWRTFANSLRLATHGTVESSSRIRQGGDGAHEEGGRNNAEGIQSGAQMRHKSTKVRLSDSRILLCSVSVRLDISHTSGLKSSDKDEEPGPAHFALVQRKRESNRFASIHATTASIVGMRLTEKRLRGKETHPAASIYILPRSGASLLLKKQVEGSEVAVGICLCCYSTAASTDTCRGDGLNIARSKCMA